MALASSGAASRVLKRAAYHGTVVEFEEEAAVHRERKGADLALQHAGLAAHGRVQLEAEAPADGHHHRVHLRQCRPMSLMLYPPPQTCCPTAWHAARDLATLVKWALQQQQPAVADFGAMTDSYALSADLQQIMHPRKSRCSPALIFKTCRRCSRS